MSQQYNNGYRAGMDAAAGLHNITRTACFGVMGTEKSKEVDSRVLSYFGQVDSEYNRGLLCAFWRNVAPEKLEENDA